MPFSHGRSDLPLHEWRPLEKHLRDAAELASGFASVFGAGNWGRALGELHDIGKCKQAFQEYLHRVVGNPEHGPSGIDHSTAGARLAWERDENWGRILAYVLAGHHAGLPDGRGSGPTLERRLERELPECAADMAQAMGKELPDEFPVLINQQRFGFQLAFFIRMLFSCLVDADRLDTEAFMDPENARLREQPPGMADLASRFFPELDRLVSGAPDSRVNRLRRKVLEECQRAADLRTGLFSLTVPTGGGKTLSSLAFALRHARSHGLKRIMYVMPYTSIIEQNAAVFRSFLGDDAVLEHHSSFDFDAGEQGESDNREWAKLAAENWDAPLVATTAVQFFESLFSSRPGKCRKLHNLAGSVVVLDEAQMLPRHLLLACLEALRELSSNYGTSIVLCTATQPALSRREDFLQGLNGVREIVSDPHQLHAELKRTQVVHLGELSDADLTEQLAEEEQVLCITNTRGHARTLYEILKNGTESVYHLSASMCPVHRREKLEEIREALRRGEPCRVVSTQLVEAGVDVDFPVVYRAATGIDSVAQAAGRCDREGRLTEERGGAAGRVYVFYPEQGLPPGHFRLTADTSEEVLRHYGDPLDPEAVEMYFRHLFWRAGSELDKNNILYKLGEDAKNGNIPFREIDSLFRMIEEEKEAIVVPLDSDAEKMVNSLPYVTHPGALLRRLQPYTVQVHARWLHHLAAGGAVEYVRDRIPVLRNRDIYSSELGLCPEDPAYRDAESLIV
ncbi:MAG: CRISPR-associated helicase Cas3' [Desulfohalobiaceae bacterium]|nr:CRISPR-associated helicase Cas3' [Desulfohalobiaceae bacterium]